VGDHDTLQLRAQRPSERTVVYCSIDPYFIYMLSLFHIYVHACGTWRLTKNNKKRVEATEMDALRRSSRISRTERIRNVTIRQQIGLEETIIKETEQNQLIWYGHV